MKDVSRRERQILDVLYGRGRATASEIQAALPDAPSYSAIRALLRILEEKGHVRHVTDGARYVYTATVPRKKASLEAIRHLVSTFFDGSPAAAAIAFVDESAEKLSPEDLDRLEALIARARRGKSPAKE
jgi:BlaI family transcriptional regulator, penicillinase repressor